MSDSASDGRRPATERKSMAIADVARTLGVSSMTVSRVINGRPGVGPQTRERLQREIARLGYRPNPSARALRIQRGLSIGFVSPTSDLASPLARSAVGAQHAAEAAGYSVTIIALDDTTDEGYARARSQLIENGIEAAIVVSSRYRDARRLAALTDGIPTVGLWTPGTPIESIGARVNVLGSALATGHLLELGHEVIGHLSGPEGMMTTDARRHGWATTITEHGLTPGPLVEGDWTPQSGYLRGTELLAAHPEVTAIFAANDTMALGVLHAARELGRRIPEDVSLVGYDDLPEARHLLPSLTTVAQDFEQLGIDGLRAAVAKLEGRPLALGSETAPELKVRASTSER